MNIRTLTSVAASLVVICGIVTANLWRELRAEREATTALRTEHAESEANARVAQTAAPHVDIVAPAPAPTTVPRKPPDAPSTKLAAASRGVVIIGNGGISEQELLKDPDYRKARLTMLRASLAQSYPGLAAELGLSKEQADRLFDLLAESQMSMSSQLALVLTGDEQADRANAAQITSQAQALMRQQNDSLRAMLGDSGYQQWQNYQQTRSARMQANTYANVLAQAGTPLDDAQVKALMTAMVEEQKSMQQDIVALGRMVDPANPQSRTQAQEALRSRQADGSQHILDAASSQLSAQQLSVLRTQFEQQDAINSASQRVRERTEALRLQQ